MKQVNVSLPDDLYEILVREVGKRMVETGEVFSVSALAADLLVPKIKSFNDNKDTS
jgi:hypothetical protein